jgi:hypothetical protein
MAGQKASFGRQGPRAEKLQCIIKRLAVLVSLLGGKKRGYYTVFSDCKRKYWRGIGLVLVDEAVEMVPLAGITAQGLLK